MKPKTLFFSPNAGIWVHSFPEAKIADAITKEGSEVIYVTCERLFSGFCTTMSAHGLDQTSEVGIKSEICEKCIEFKDNITSFFNFNKKELSNYIKKDDYKKIDNYFNSITRDNFEKFEIDGIQIGKIACFDILLQYKKGNLLFSDKEWESYLINLKNTLLSYYASIRMLEDEKPDRVIIYNTLYSINKICAEIATKMNIPVYFLHAGENFSNRLSTMIISKGYMSDYRIELVNKWQSIRNYACNKEELFNIKQHFMTLFKGKHMFAYSSSLGINGNIRDKFSINKNQKIVVAALSSYDERFAAEYVGVLKKDEKLIFKTQIVWITELIKFFSLRSELFLIIRVHPREFPNKREGVRSEHSFKLEESLRDLPDNIKINWPTDNISIYDIAKEANLFLNAWSSVGEEMSLFGIPVLLYSPNLILYPPDLNYVAKDKQDYFNKINEILYSEWNFEITRKAFRWYALKLNKAVFEIFDDFHYYENPSAYKKTILQKLISRFYIKKALFFRKVTKEFIMKYPSHAYDIGSYKKLKNSKQILDLIKNLYITKISMDSQEKNQNIFQEEKDIRSVMKEILDTLSNGETEIDYILLKNWNNYFKKKL
jgi:hypothetical protein